MSSKNRKKKSDPLDRYYTPQYLTDAIVKTTVYGLSAGGHTGPLRVLDPCAGHGEFVNSIRRNFPDLEVIATEYDIDPQNPRITKADFLKTEPDPSFDLITSNIPFTYALEFFEHAFRFRKDEYSMVSFLARINWLGSCWRAKWLRKHTPKSIMVSPKRPSFDGKGSDSTEYCAFAYADICYLKPLIILETEDLGSNKHPLYEYQWPGGVPYKGWPKLETETVDMGKGVEWVDTGGRFFKTKEYVEIEKEVAEKMLSSPEAVAALEKVAAYLEKDK